MEWKKSVAQATGARAEKGWKATLFESSRLLLGVNCMEPGQTQTVHAHGDQDKFYLVQSGEGLFRVGGDSAAGGPGEVIWAPAGIPHGVENTGTERLVMVVGLAPAPAAKPRGA